MNTAMIRHLTKALLIIMALGSTGCITSNGGSANKNNQLVALPDLIKQIKHSIREAGKLDPDNPHMFKFVSPVKLQLNTVTKKSVESGLPKLWVIPADANVKYSRAQTQTITLTLDPLLVGQGGRNKTTVTFKNTDDYGEPIELNNVDWVILGGKIYLCGEDKMKKEVWLLGDAIKKIEAASK